MIMVPKINQFDRYMSELVINDFNLEAIEDGSYTGNVDSGVIVVEVQVDVEDHQITHIELIKHQNGQGEPAEVIIDHIVEEQTIMVDDISGATYSSQVIKKAVEIALTRK